MSAKDRVNLGPRGLVSHHARKARSGYLKMATALEAGNLRRAKKWQHWNAYDAAIARRNRLLIINGMVDDEC